MAAHQKLRVGIVGTGGIARSVHIPAYKKLPDQVELVSAFDVDADRLARVADEAGIPYRFASMAGLLEGPSLDAVSICTPPSSHPELAEQAFRAGLHVMLEKPAAADLAGTRRILDAAKRSGKKLMVGYQHRFSWQTKALKQFIEAGDLGDIYYTRALSTRRRGIPGWGVFTSKGLSGGGPLMDIGVHVLDQAMYLIGSPKPATALGMTYLKIADKPGSNMFGPYDPSRLETEDFGIGLVRFDGGTSLLLEASWALNVEKSTHDVQIAGTLGGATCYPLKLFKDQHGVLTDTVALEPRRPEGSQDEKIAHFVQCVLEDREPLVKPAEIFNVAAILDAIYRSSETGKAVDL